MPRTVTFLSLILTLIVSIVTPISASAAGPAEAALVPPADATRVVELVNVERARYGLPALRWETRLASSAVEYATFMAANDLFAHFVEGVGLVQRDEAHGYLGWSFLGENLARDKASPEEVVAAWLESPTHRANLLALEACQVGIGRSSSFWAMEIGC